MWSARRLLTPVSTALSYANNFRRLSVLLAVPLSGAECRELTRRRLETREPRFLERMRQMVYAVPMSPYLSLLKLAGCEYRDLELLVLPDGTLRPPLFITSHIHRVPGVVQYQLRQERVEAVTIQIVTGAGYDEGAGDRLRRETEAILPGVRIIIERVLEIPRTPGGKHRYVVVSPEVQARIPTPSALSGA